MANSCFSCDPEFAVILIRKLRSYGRLSRAERRLAMKSIALVACVRLALWVLPFLKLQALCERFRGAGRPSEHPADAQQIARAVRLAGRYVPRATCLTQALEIGRASCRERV